MQNDLLCIFHLIQKVGVRVHVGKFSRLTFRRRTQDGCLVSMVTVPGDECPASAGARAALVAAATQTLKVEEAGTRGELGVPQHRADVAVQTGKTPFRCVWRGRGSDEIGSVPYLKPTCLQITLASRSLQ